MKEAYVQDPHTQIHFNELGEWRKAKGITFKKRLLK
jgi:hypothetical protein